MIEMSVVTSSSGTPRPTGLLKMNLNKQEVYYPLITMTNQSCKIMLINKEILKQMNT